MAIPYPHTLAIALRPVMREAAKKIMDYYQGQKFEKSTKSDGSFVTSADKASDDIITQRLSALFPNIPIVSEESFNPDTYPPTGNGDNENGYFLIDPLDGTNGFLNRTGHFAINIALIYQRQPIFGFIWSPSEDKGYFGAPQFGGFVAHNMTQTLELTSHKNHFGPAKIIMSSGEKVTQATQMIIQNHTTRPIGEVIHYGSALKFGLMAEGLADIYPRQLPCSEWDIAAGQAIITALGGKIITILDKKPLVYGKNTANTPPFLAMI